MITSIIFVFLTLLEYTFLLRKRRVHLLEAAIKEQKGNKRRWSSKQVVRPKPQEKVVDDGVKFIKVASPPTPTPTPPPSASKEDTCAKDQQEESFEEYCVRIDRRAAIIMPTLFVAFNLIYWPYYVGQRN
ncbi:gamma-aminobutyric acid receptor subunit alpha-3-like [Penaeus japonicus]|uniref:gamma-aminobutyric acid receptor subunit alpha-3-like n=1 Tax=Penaeus japonicus TaxID=27405 RepID=UPI001C713E4C|nr:gamma-aminobutyric acid receptor subunit alpha-3-like [Penaeus japonicus]